MHLKSTAGKPKLPPSQNYQNSKNIYFTYEIHESPISLLIKWLLECMYPISKLSQMNIIQFKVNIPSFLCLFFLFFNYFSLMLFFVFLRINFVGKKTESAYFWESKKIAYNHEMLLEWINKTQLIYRYIVLFKVHVYTKELMLIYMKD